MLSRSTVFTYEMLNTVNSIKFAVLKIKSHVSKNKVISFDFIGQRKVALVTTLKNTKGTAILCKTYQRKIIIYPVDIAADTD